MQDVHPVHLGGGGSGPRRGGEPDGILAAEAADVSRDTTVVGTAEAHEPGKIIEDRASL